MENRLSMLRIFVINFHLISKGISAFYLFFILYTFLEQSASGQKKRRSLVWGTGSDIENF